MKKTRAVEEEIVEWDVVCQECGEAVFLCDACEKDIEPEDVMYCNKRTRKHYCSKCGRKNERIQS